MLPVFQIKTTTTSLTIVMINTPYKRTQKSMEHEGDSDTNCN